MNWTWSRAVGPDVADIHQLSEQMFSEDNQGLFEIDHQRFDHNITTAIVNQFYQPLSELLLVARDDTGRLVAWCWAGRSERVCWSQEEMVAVKMVHVDLTLPVRTRVRIISEMMGYWEDWAQACGINIICSTSMRRDQSGFLHLHASRGYDVRGSIAYKRIDKEQQ